MNYRLAGVMLLCFMLVACSPVYKTVHDYIPPQTEEGLACLNNCEIKRVKCGQQCKSLYDTCLLDSEKQAVEVFPEAQEFYEDQLRTWGKKQRIHAREMRSHAREKRLLLKQRKLYKSLCNYQRRRWSACDKVNEIDYELSHLQVPSELEPRPERPTLTSEIERLQDKNCSLICDCDTSHKLCFSSCGGEVLHRKVCIENCYSWGAERSWR